LPLLYKTFVRPILEYTNAIWGPYYITDQKLLERVQRRATKLVPSLIKGTILCLAFITPAIAIILLQEEARWTGIMILVYQILNGLLDVDSSFFFAETFSQATSDHNFKLNKQNFIMSDHMFYH